MSKSTPNTSCLQKQLNKVGDEIRNLSEMDMAKQRTAVKDTLASGYSCDTPIPAEGDRQYNTILRTCPRNNPFAPERKSPPRKSSLSPTRINWVNAVICFKAEGTGDLSGT